MTRPALVLLIAVLAMGWAGPIVRLSEAPAIVIAAWRLIFSLGIVVGVLLFRRSGAVRPRGREWWLGVAAGAALAAHFWTWIASVELTSVASSVALVCMQPVFVAILSATVLKEPPSRAQWLGVGVACAGALVIGWGDFGRGRAPLLGDALALLGAVLVAIYYTIGRKLRQRLDLWSYVGVVYGVAAVLLVGVALLSADAPLVGYPSREWLLFIALAALPTMLGHTGANYALAHFRAYIVNLALLGEPILATLLAWGLPAIREVPPTQTIVGGLLIVAGIVVAIIGRRAARSAMAAPREGAHHP